MGLQSQQGMPIKCCNLRTRTYLKTVTHEILEMPLSRNYNEVLFQKIHLCFSHNIHNLIPCFYFLLHQKKAGGKPPNPSPRSTPSSTHFHTWVEKGIKSVQHLAQDPVRPGL